MRPYLALTVIALLLVCSCGDDTYDEAYPDIITEMADVETDVDGRMTRLVTDDGKSYSISNALTGYQSLAVYRTVCGFVPSGNSATVYQMKGVYVLADSTHTAATDPVPMVCAWMAGRYINMQLAPLSQGGTQWWGYIVGERTEGRLHLTLHHRQNSDPMSFTVDTYASIAVDRLDGIAEVDTITLHVNTPTGDKEWNFRR